MFHSHILPECFIAMWPKTNTFWRNSFLAVCHWMVSNERANNEVFINDSHLPCTDRVLLAVASNEMFEKSLPDRWKIYPLKRLNLPWSVKHIQPKMMMDDSTKHLHGNGNSEVSVESFSFGMSGEPSLLVSNFTQPWKREVWGSEVRWDTAPRRNDNI